MQVPVKPRDALALYLWPHSVGWYLAEDYGNGDEHCPMGKCGSEKDY